ncbi:type I-E CRISPR-associated protein Cse1/CasA [Corynebacterium felinum]|uniref:CRISPR system Cascade subunit CasA n=1 Tax=Corynebacterium felinum TaxID=131318 RepID=A0ABU2B4W6_9CORY|nr:type I-E CRISPR-associated protein Cse1/CasA [Corynebacterium felinum]MDF5820576.1 type I-E CRISPR-associated protein Cse1/CasA [Corynebacterium felinum]MDR7353655.1 CRISPR system Cascade subunit CasA [Corynebacterium felinum]WJY95834.1 CRISPR-associated protein CasA/Cse1 [Corynebacterium felinum]
MITQFNLIEEKWIPVLKPTNMVELVSIREFFQQSHTIVDFGCELASMRFAIFRIMFAILRRSLDAKMHSDPEGYWTELWEADELPLDLIEKYLTQVHDRFDLLHPQKPFLQTPGLHVKSGEWKELGILVADSPGEGALFTQTVHTSEITFDSAARWLIHANAFDYSGIKSGAVGDPRVKGGKGYPMGIGWAGWMGCTIITGANMKETLLLNHALQEDVDLSKDLPIWEEEPLSSVPRPNAQPYGQLSLITWPQRRILLHSSGTGIDGVLICNGDPVDYLSQLLHETMTPWRFSEPQSKKAKKPVFMPKTLEPGDSLWRGFSSFMPQFATGKEILNSYSSYDSKDDIPSFEPPETVTQIANRIGNPLPEDFSLRIDVTSVVYGSQSASFEEILHDKLVFPALLLAVEGADLRDLVETAVKRSMEATEVLANFAANICRAETDSKDAPAHARDRAKAEAFSLLDAEFPQWLSRLPISKDSAEEELQKWTDYVRSLFSSEGNRLVQEASPSAWHGRKRDDVIFTVGQAEAWFKSNLYKALPPQEKRKEKTDD